MRHIDGFLPTNTTLLNACSRKDEYSRSHAGGQPLAADEAGNLVQEHIPEGTSCWKVLGSEVSLSPVSFLEHLLAYPNL